MRSWYSFYNKLDAHLYHHLLALKIVFWTPQECGGRQCTSLANSHGYGEPQLWIGKMGDDGLFKRCCTTISGTAGQVCK